MAYAHPSPLVPLSERHRSQSDSDLLTPRQEVNGALVPKGVATSVDDMEVVHVGGKHRRSFFYRLVRPWKWGRRFKKKEKEGVLLFVVVFVRP